MSHITLKSITKRFGAITALNDAFEVNDAEFFVLLGATARQDHHAPRNRRPDQTGSGERCLRRAAGRCAAAGGSRCRIRLPAILAVPYHDRVRQSRLPARAHRCAK